MITLWFCTCPLWPPTSSWQISSVHSWSQPLEVDIDSPLQPCLLLISSLILQYVKRIPLRTQHVACFAHMHLCVFHDRVESVCCSGEQHTEKTSTMQQFRFYKSETGLDLTLCCCIHQMNVYFLHPQQHEPLLGSTSDDSMQHNTPASSLLTWIKILTPLHFLHKNEAKICGYEHLHCFSCEMCWWRDERHWVHSCTDRVPARWKLGPRMSPFTKCDPKPGTLCCCLVLVQEE